MALKAFNETHLIGAAHFNRAVVFDCNEDCYVSIYANSPGVIGASLNIVLFDRLAQVPNQPTLTIVNSDVDLSKPGNNLAAALAFSAGDVLEARTFGISDVEVTISAITGPDAAPSVMPIR